MMKTRINGARVSIAATCCGVLLLAGCSTGESEASVTAAATEAAQAAPNQAAAATMPSGITGEIAYVADSVAQVQDGSSQTAVRYTSDTVFTQELELALADVSVGSCVLVTLGDDSNASTVMVSDAADDGTCSVGLGGGQGGAADGGAPGGQPAGGDAPALPDDAALPTALPDGVDAPTGGGAGFDSALIVAGTVTAVASDSLTVESTDGESTVVPVTSDASISGTADADETAVVVGMCMTAMGEADDAGGYDATRISVFHPDADDSCVTASAVGGRDSGSRPAGGNGADATRSTLGSDQ